MATIGSTNFYLNLKDKTLRLEDRLKLLKYSWKSGDVFIPNKEQVLVDLLTGLLINKKKEQLSDSDVVCVWSCLRDVLQTRTAAQPNSILLRQSSTQLLTESLLAVDEGCGFTSSLIGCFQSIMASDSLSAVFTSKLDIMVSVLKGLCGVLSLDLCNMEQLISPLVHHTVDRFVSALKTAPNQNQILQKICDVFLPKFMPLWSAQSSDAINTLSTALQAVLCHRDHQQSYDVYLKAKHSQSGGHVHKKAKPVEHLFVTFTKLLQTDPEQCSLYLPVVYENFIQNNCHNGIHLTAHYMMVELCSLIGLRSDNNNLLGPMETSVVFRGVNQLLKLIQGRELYDQNLDEKNGSVQIKFYRHIAQVLIGCRQSDDVSGMTYSDWYSCFNILLHLNHLILEARLLDIFTVGWIEAEIREEDIGVLDELLHHLIKTYSKLRQIPKLLTKLLGTLCLCQGNTTLQFTPRFLQSYGEVIQSLPQGMMLEIWKKFAASLKAHFIETRPETGHFQGICLLFHHYLVNVKVADYTVTDLTLKSVQELLVVMETDILAPLLKEAIEEKKIDVLKLKSTLFLSHACGGMVSMLALYAKYRAIELQKKVLVSHPGDLSFVHGYMEMQQWMKLYKRVMKHGDPGLLYVWDMLTVQKVRSMLLFKEVSDWSVIADTMATVMTFLQDGNITDVDVNWSGHLEDVTGSNLVTARWHLLTSNMAAIYSVLSEEQVKTVANFTVNCMVKTKSSSSMNELSLHTISCEFMKSTILMESGVLLSHVVTQVWALCGVLFSGGNQKSNKKKKRDGLTSAVSSVMSTIGDSDVSWSAQMNSESLEKVQESSRALTLMWNSNDALHLSNIKQIHDCVKIIQCFPLEHLWSCDQIRCLTGLLAVLCVNDKLDDQSKSDNLEELSSECIELCTHIVESCGMVPLFQIIDVDSFLDSLQKLLWKYRSVDLRYYKCLVLAEVSCQAIVRDYKVLEKLPTFTEKLCSHMENGEFVQCRESGSLTLTLFILQEVCKILNRPYTNENLKTTCTKIYNSLSQSVLKLSPLLDSSNFSHVEAVLVRTYAVVLLSIHKDEVVKQMFLENFPRMLHWSRGVLQNVEKTDVYTVMSALIFLHTMSRYHILLKMVLEIDAKLNIWKLLIIVLRKLLGNQSVWKENQSDLKPECQSMDVTPQVETTHTDDQSKKRKRRKSKSTHGDDSVVTENDQSDRADEQMEKMNRLLEGLQDSEQNKMILTKDKSATSLGTVSTSEDQCPDVGEAVLNASMISALSRSLMFEGQLERQRSKVMKVQVQSVMAALLVSFDLDLFKKVTQELVDDMHTSVMFTDRGRIQSSVYIWRYLLKLDFSDEQAKVIKYSAKDMTLNFQCITQQLAHVVSDELVVGITIPILNAQQQMLAVGPKFLPSRTSILCLYSCVYTPLGGSTYFLAFNAVCSVLDTLLVRHSDVVFQNISAYIGCAKRLLLSVVEQSNQDKISQQPHVIKNLMGCAYQMERLFSLISSHKVEFGKVAMYVVSDYVTAVQKVTLLPAIKRGLVPAVYKMLDLCDKHAISQLHVVLSHGVTEVFRLLYSEYTKFHKYQGKI